MQTCRAPSKTDKVLFLTYGVWVVVDLKLDASIQLSGDEAVGGDHDHARNEEQRQQQQNVPAGERERKGGREGEREGEGVGGRDRERG